MAWSDAAFRERVVARAQELGTSLRALLAKAGVSHDTLDKAPVAGRRIDTLEKIATAAEWSLAEIMGFNVYGRISVDLALKATRAARRILDRLPHEANTEEREIALFARIYDALEARRRDGLEADEATLNNYVEILTQTYLDPDPTRGG